MSDVTTPPVEFKTCSKCDINQPRSNFHKDSRSKDNRSSWCKQCSKAACQEYYKNNKTLLNRRYCNKQARKKQEFEFSFRPYDASKEPHRNEKAPESRPREASVRRMLESYGGTVYSTGFPDNMVISPSGRIFFVEVKGLHETIRKSQRRTFTALQEQGFEVFIARVEKKFIDAYLNSPSSENDREAA